MSNYTLAQWREALTQIPTLSIVTEMGNLFDAVTGIYANASQHGELWERPVSLELLDPTNAVPGRFQENCGLRIRGGFSRNADFRKHSLRVFFRREYGAGKLNYPLFENEGAQEFETFDLRTSQNYSWPRGTESPTFETMVREVFCRKTLGDMGQPYRRSRYYHLYLNGQYWGLYETDERPEASYGQSYFGGSKTNFDVVKCGNRGVTPTFATEATDGNMIVWSNLWVMTQVMRTNATTSNYFRILGANPDGTRNPNLPVLIDVDNLIDYMLEIFYSGDGDATLSAFLSNNQPNNWFGMRDRTNPNVGFRFFNSDCEHTLGSPSSQVNRTGPFPNSNEGNFVFSNPQWMHEELSRNAEYRLRFADRVQKHFFNGGALTLEACTNRFMAKANQITRAIRAYSARWGDAFPGTGPFGESHWTNALAFCLNWFPTRAGLVLSQLRAYSYGNLFPTVAAPIFSQLGGAVPEGYSLEMIHTNSSGVIFFTTDGTDPRLVGGGVSPAAQSYSVPFIINAPMLIRVRVLTGGNWSPLLEYIFYPPQDLSKLLITEIMYHPPAIGLVDGDEFEFLELKNAGTNTLHLGGLKFTGITFTFTNGTTLAPGQFFVLVRNPAQFAAKYPGVTIHGVFGGGLANGGETITLSHALGGKVLSVTYDDLGPWPVTPDGFGFSLVPVNPNANPDPDNAANWRASSMPGGSPGADDPASAMPTVLINEVLSHTETGLDFIELFNATAATADLAGWFLSDDPGAPKKFRIPDGTMIAPLSYLVFDEMDFNPTPGTNTSFSLSARGDDVYLFSGDANTNLTGYSHGFSFGAAPDGETFGRYVISTGEEQFPWQLAPTPGQPNVGPRVGPVVLNEIMHHPNTGDDEFVELKNITTNAVALYDADHPTNTWRLNGVGFDFPANTVMGPGELLLLVATDPATFRARYSIPASVQILGPYGGQLQDSGERLELQRPDVPDTNGFAYITVDEVRYNDHAPWPAAADGSGPSLQRKISAGYGNDPANWEAAIATPGADFSGGQSPAIVTQPQNQSAAIGQTVVFNVAADGPPPLFYQWSQNGGAILGATGSSLVLTNVQSAQAGNYTVVVFNDAGSAASAVAHLTVVRPPTILTQPVNQSVFPGSNGTFSVTASGNGILRYQWRFNGTNIPGATAASYVVLNAQPVHEGDYTVMVTDGEGPALSAVARLTLVLHPIFTLQPTNRTAIVKLGVPTNVTFSASAVSSTPVRYLWRFNGTNILDATNSSLTVSNVQESSAGDYAVVATDNFGPLASSNATLTVLLFPAITVQPQPAVLTVVAGDTVTFSVSATGTLPLSYRWRKIPGGINLTNMILN
ncbi:MAG TPA: lamin tail domain-containing protein, partial [Verrucomicrobiae bacterium]